MKRKLLSQIDFILAHPEILRRMQKLTIKDEWPGLIKEAMGIESYMVGHAAFFKQILGGIENVLGRLNLSELCCMAVDLTPGMLEALARMDALRTAEFVDCPSHPGPAELAALPRLSSVTNACLTIRHEAEDDLLELMALLPNVRCLVIEASGGADFEIPGAPQDFSQWCNPFRCLERLYISQIGDIDALSSWLRLCASAVGGLRLTHFKLKVGPGLEEDELMNLIGALETAPLRVLVLEGIAYAELDLFDILAETFPQLEALTLIRRENTSQITTKPCGWPHATWEYAPHLAGFRCLKYFAWNFRIDPVPETVTWDLPLMEAGFADPAAWPEKDWETDAMYECKSVADLFEAYCETLEILVCLSKPANTLVWDSRSRHFGGVGRASYQRELFRRIEEYNTDGFSSMRSWFF